MKKIFAAIMIGVATMHPVCGVCNTDVQAYAPDNGPKEWPHKAPRPSDVVSWYSGLDCMLYVHFLKTMSQVRVEEEKDGALVDNAVKIEIPAGAMLQYDMTPYGSGEYFLSVFVADTAVHRQVIIIPE